MIGVLSVMSTVIGGLLAILTVSALKGRYLTILPTDRSVFLAVFFAGLAMCSLGIQISLKAGSFRTLGVVSGLLLGIPMILMTVYVFSGRPVPILTTTRNALVALMVIMSVKWVLAMVQSGRVLLAQS